MGLTAAYLVWESFVIIIKRKSWTHISVSSFTTIWTLEMTAIIQFNLAEYIFILLLKKTLNAAEASWAERRLTLKWHLRAIVCCFNPGWPPNLGVNRTIFRVFTFFFFLVFVLTNLQTDPVEASHPSLPIWT